MANRTAWVAGLGAGLTWTNAFATASNADLNATLTPGNSMLSSATAIDNATNLDQFMAVSFVGAVNSGPQAIAQGAYLAFWIAYLNEDATTYGDGLMTAGSVFTGAPGWGPPDFVMPLYASTRTIIQGQVKNIVIPPIKFALACQNGTGWQLATGTTNVCKFITYNQNLNS
jgi:hypothetical protein